MCLKITIIYQKKINNYKDLLLNENGYIQGTVYTGHKLFKEYNLSSYSEERQVILHRFFSHLKLKL